MSKDSTKAPEKLTPAQQAGFDATMTPNQAAPKRAKRKPVKYTNIVESGYKPTDNPEAMHPLDKPAITSRGGLKFPGVEFEYNVLGVVVRIPAKATIVKNPTVRQLLRVLDELYK